MADTRARAHARSQEALVPDASGLLTQLERDVLLHLNLVRTAPDRYAQMYLEPRRWLFTDKLYLDPLSGERPGLALRTVEGAPAVEEAIRALEQTGQMDALSVSPALTRSARDHAREQSASGKVGHSGADGSQPADRVRRYGAWQQAVGEVIAYGPVSGREVVSRLLIDDGVHSRGHRHNILNPRFRAVGIAAATHPRFGHAVVIDLAGSVVESE